MVTPNFNPFDNPFLDYLEGTESGRRALFSSHLGDQGFNRQKRRTLFDDFDELQSTFLGQLASVARQGGQPTQRFNDFLGDFDFEGYYSGLSRGERGIYDSRFAPRTRHLLRQ